MVDNGHNSQGESYTNPSPPTSRKRFTSAVVYQDDDKFSKLSHEIAAHILSFTIESTKDLAMLRLISKNVCHKIFPLIPTSAGSKIRRCCSSFDGNTNKYSSSSFAAQLVESPNGEELPQTGDIIHSGELSSPNNKIEAGIFLDFKVESILFLDVQPGEHYEYDENRRTLCRSMSERTENKCREICEELANCKSVETLEVLRAKAFEESVFLPVSITEPCVSTTSELKGSMEEWYKVPVLLRVKQNPTVDEPRCLKNTINNEYYGGKILQLAAMCCTSENHIHDCVFSVCKEHDQSVFNAYVQGDGSALVALELIANFELLADLMLGYSGEINSLIFSGLCDKHFNQKIKEGVAVVDGIVSAGVRNELTVEINNLARNSPVDYHPHSNNVVRDLVHPALFSYIKNVSKLKFAVGSIPPCQFDSDDLSNSDQDVEETMDYFGRKYEKSVYQWLPAYFDISLDGSCKILDYVNNLVPRTKYSKLYASLEVLFQQALPSFEAVYSYVRVIKPQIRYQNDEEIDYDDTDLQQPLERHTSLRGQKLQVITKIVDYELGPSSKMSYDGVWHVEGMSHEEIVATGLYILERDEDITGGSLLFQRAFFENEAGYMYWNAPQMRHPAMDKIIESGLCPLGTVDTLEGRLIVFPNSHVHKVSLMERIVREGKSHDNSQVSRRRIVVFFLVNPEKRIVSTHEVGPQQKEVGGEMSREEAFNHRLELMKERKYTKQDWNVRDIELCEH